MAGTYSGGRPYGDIYTIPTSAVDNIAARLYNEHKQRELEKRQQDKALDDEFGRNVAGVKSADIPDITKAYNDFKQANIALQKKGQKATPQDQMDVMIKKANAFSAIGASKEDKERIKNRIAEVKGDKKGRYKLDAHTTLAEMLNTPTSKRKIDEDDERLANQYSFPDLAKVAGNIIGTPKEVKIPTGKPSVKGSLYDDEEVYTRVNHPNEMYNKGFLEVFTRPDRQNFERVVLDSLTDQEKEDLKTRYFAKVSSPEFKAIYGEVQPFPESAEKTELGQAMALTVMSAVDKLPTKPLRVESKTNQEDIMDRKVEEGLVKQKAANLEWDRRTAQKQKNSLINIAANKQGQDIVNGTSGNSFDEFGGVNPIYVTLSSGGLIGGITGTGNVTGKIEKGVVFDQDGNLFTGEIKVDKKDVPINVATSLSSGKVSVPNVVPLTVKNGIIVGMKTNNGVVDRTGIENLQKKVNTEPIKGAQPVYGNTKQPASNTPAPPKATTGYSRADLKANGWTDAQIDEAVKAKKIKLN